MKRITNPYGHKGFMGYILEHKNSLPVAMLYNLYYLAFLLCMMITSRKERRR